MAISQIYQSFEIVYSFLFTIIFVSFNPLICHQWTNGATILFWKVEISTTTYKCMTHSHDRTVCSLYPKIIEILNCDASL